MTTLVLTPGRLTLLRDVGERFPCDTRSLADGTYVDPAEEG